MIQLFVNFKISPDLPEWNEVVLPEDFSFTETEENPEITNVGTYTLDITTSLLEAKNAIAFRFLNRENNSDIKQTAAARKIENGKVTSGTIEIQSNTNLQVVFQFLAGNSELNYIAQNDTKIWEYDWGTETAIDYARALLSISESHYGAYNFVCAPVMLSDEMVNLYTISADTASPAMAINGITGKIVMQPWLLYYINKFPEILGYTLVYNVLNDDPRAKVMYFLNASGTLKYADALPDWSVSEFKQYIEEFFNVSFLVDAATKTISIHSLASNLINKKIVSPVVLDEFNRDFKQESKSIRLDFTRVSYDLEESNYFKWNRLSDAILKNYSVVDYPNLAAIKTWLKTNSTDIGWPLNVIFHDVEKNDHYIHITVVQPTASLLTLPITQDGDSDFLRKIQLVDKFAPVGDNGTKELSLKIIPAEMAKNYVNVNVNSGTAKAYFQYPKYSNAYYINKTKTLIESVEGTESSIPRPSKLEVALYTGRIKTYFETNVGYVFDIPTLYPFSHTDFVPEFTVSFDRSNLLKLQTWIETYFMPAAVTTLRLKNAGGVLDDYHQATVIDTSLVYQKTLIDDPDVSATNIFLIDNLKYIPISLEREKSKNQKTVLGEFYRML